MEQSESGLLFLADKLGFVHEHDDLGIPRSMVGDETARLVAARLHNPEIRAYGLIEGRDGFASARTDRDRSPPNLVDQCLFGYQVPVANVDEKRVARMAFPQVFDQ